MSVLPSLNDHLNRAAKIQNAHRARPNGTFFKRAGCLCAGTGLLLAALGIWAFPAIDNSEMLIKLGVSAVMLLSGLAFAGASVSRRS